MDKTRQSFCVFKCYSEVKLFCHKNQILAIFGDLSALFKFQQKNVFRAYRIISMTRLVKLKENIGTLWWILRLQHIGKFKNNRIQSPPPPSLWIKLLYYNFFIHNDVIHNRNFKKFLGYYKNLRRKTMNLTRILAFTGNLDF